MKILRNANNASALMVIIGLLLNGVLWAFTAWNYLKVTDLIPLHYTIYFGIDKIGTRISLFKYPTIGLIIFSVNLILAYILREEKLLGYFLKTAGVFSQILIFLAEIAVMMKYY